MWTPEEALVAFCVLYDQLFIIAAVRGLYGLCVFMCNIDLLVFNFLVSYLRVFDA